MDAQRPLLQRLTFKLVFLVLLLSFSSLLCFSTVLSAQVTRDGSPSPAQVLTLNDEQIESWLGREGRVNHPVVEGVEHKTEAKLEFYFDKEYAMRAQFVIASAERAKAKTLRFLPEEALDNVHIYLLGDMNSYFEAQDAQGRAPDWAAGLAILRDGVILIRLSSKGTSRIEPEKTLAHELNHVALRRMAHESSFPHWFYEGFAMLATDDWNLDRATTLANASMGGHVMALGELNAAFSSQGTRVDLAYAQSAHFVSWVASQHGDEAISKTIAGVAEGKSFDDAFLAATGRSPIAAYQTWHEAMAKAHSKLALFFSPEGVFFFISVFAAIGLSLAILRRQRIKRRRYENRNDDIPVSELPANLRNFGPFV